MPPAPASSSSKPSTSKASSNWSQLQKTLGKDKGKGKAREEGGRGKKRKLVEREDAASDSASPLPWFADSLSTSDQATFLRGTSSSAPTPSTSTSTTPLPPLLPASALPAPSSSGLKAAPGKYLALDCEMVGVGPQGAESVLARVSIVNFHGAVVMDTFVRPREKVTDYRTWVSGVTAKDVEKAPHFKEVQAQVAELLKDRILVGHALHNDLKALLLVHPRPLSRDTSLYQPLRDLAKTKFPSLKKLAKLVLGIEIQSGRHSSVDDARATMEVYKRYQAQWEAGVARSGKAKSAGAGGRKEKAEVKVDVEKEKGRGKEGTKVKAKAKAGWWEEEGAVPAGAGEAAAEVTRTLKKARVEGAAKGVVRVKVRA